LIVNMKISLKNYDFLWTVYGQTYLFTSMWLSDYYLKHDFITCLDHNVHSFFVSKVERKKLSQVGYDFYLKKVGTYRNLVSQKFKITEKYFTKSFINKLNRLDNRQLARLFVETGEYIKDLWKNYFWTEYFCLDKVAEVIKEQPNSKIGRLLQKNVQLMGKLKYQQRHYLNRFFLGSGVMAEFYKIIAKRLYLSVNQVADYHYLELAGMLKGNKVEIPNRNYAVIGKFSFGQSIFGSKAKVLIDALGKVNLKIKELKGSIGYAGFYRGTVKRIDIDFSFNRSKKQILAMKKGQVLVSGSTGPEMILACKKAGAIVTDEGGITSHAAIVSRELKIPCVIGTKIATKVFQDGDLVEVDANQGVVRKL